MEPNTPDFEEPGLPPLTWEGHAWVAVDKLPSWAGFQSRGGAYGARDRGEPSIGRVQVSISTPYDESTPPQPSQLAAYCWLKEHEAEVAAAVLDAALRFYPDARDEWLQHYPNEASSLPAISDPKDMKKVMGLHDVHVLAAAKDGVAYVGFEFECNWDNEHGFGVLTQMARVIATGSAHVAYSPSPAIAKDGGAKLEDP